jgi:hypothetical protein
MVPRDLMVVGALPLLGTGKLDYPAIQKLIEAVSTQADEETEAIPA